MPTIQRHEAREQLLFFCKSFSKTPSRGITDPDEPPDPTQGKNKRINSLNEEKKLQGVHGKSPENSNHGQGTGRLLTSIRSGEARMRMFGFGSV